MNLENNNSISFQKGLLFGAIEIWHGGARMLIENCDKKTVKPFTDAVNAAMQAIKKGQGSAPQATTPSTSDDVVSQLKRLAALLEKGILSQEEFQAQKKKLLEL